MMFSTEILYSSHAIMLNNHNSTLFQCMASVINSETTCLTGGLQYLHQDDILFMQDVYASDDLEPDRYIQMLSKTTYWGAFAIH